MSGLIAFFKGQPTEYILKYVSGKIASEGAGLAFYYTPMNTNIMAIPTSSVDANFVFNEVTNNFQAVTIQGQFTYRIQSPRQAASLLNFTIDPRRRTYLSNDPERLPQRIANTIQMETRSEIQVRSLEETLQQSEAIAAQVLGRIREQAKLDPMGVELLNIHFLGTKPTPEVAKALEAEYRETLLRKADESIYARRAAAVEEERKIKENELHTDITLEQQRQQFIELQGANSQREAENRGKALEMEADYRVRVLQKELDVYQGLDARTVLAVAMKQIGQNASKIGNLNITPEILSALLNGAGGTGPAGEGNAKSR